MTLVSRDLTQSTDPYVLELRERVAKLEAEKVALMKAAGEVIVELQMDRGALREKLAAALARIDKLLEET